MRLPPRPGEILDRGTPLSFTFGGATIEAYAGDTIASALLASGRTVLSRSFKYHRPRGVYCCTGGCAGCLLDVDGVPSVRSCMHPVRGGEVVRAQVARGSLDRDPMAVVDRVAGPVTPVGFYYRTMIRPRRAWPAIERAMRGMTGLGQIDRRQLDRRRFDVEHRHVDTLVVGAGRSGLEAAAAAVARGESVVIVDERPEHAGLSVPGAEAIAPARAIAVYEGNLVPVLAGPLMLRFRAGRIVLATGTIDQPLLFPGNDLVGVMTPSAALRLLELWSVRPGRRAAVVAPDAAPVAKALAGAGIEVVETRDLATGVPTLSAHARRGRLERVEIDGGRVPCDLLIASSGRQPVYALAAQAGARVAFDVDSGVFRPGDLPAGIEVVGGAAGVGASAVRQAGRRGKCFVCLCEDVTAKDLERTVAEGFDALELAKRYSTVTMGPCQGRLCHLNAATLVSGVAGRPAAAIGATTSRPPWSPVPLGALAGRHHAPAKRTPMHGRHVEAGARFVWTAMWRRPQDYGDAAAETGAVHETIGAIDVSSLGALLVDGPDAAAFLERAFPNRFESMAVGQVRYAVLNTESGRVIDDGTVVRLADDTFFVTTTSTGSDVVYETFLWWLETWGLSATVTNVSAGLAGIAISGPAARTLMERLTAEDVSAEALPYMRARELRVGGVPCLVLRIGFVGELGFELHYPAAYGEYLWDTMLERGSDLGIRPFGVESLKVLRLEKQHILVGQDTDSESTMLEAGLDRMIAWDKERFVGKTALEHRREQGTERRLVGVVVGGGVVPREGTAVIENGTPIGRLTSSRWSEATGQAIGLALLPARLAVEGASVDVDVNGRLVAAHVRQAPFFDPDGARLRS